MAAGLHQGCRYWGRVDATGTARHRGAPGEAVEELYLYAPYQPIVVVVVPAEPAGCCFHKSKAHKLLQTRTRGKVGDFPV